MPRKPSKKMSMPKAKRVVAKKKKTQAKSNKDTFYLKAKNVITIRPQQGLATSNYLSCWFPLLDATNSFAVTQNSEFNLYRTMYDKVRINSIKITVEPKANVLDQGFGQSDNLFNVTGDGVIHHCVDRDDCPPGNISRLSRYPSYRKTSQLKKFTRQYSITYPSSVWLDCQNIFEDTTLLKRLGTTGGIYLYAENILEDNSEIFNEPLAEVHVEFGCVFQGKVSGNLAYDPQTGVVSISPTHPSQVLANTPVTAIRGTIADVRTDISGNVVAVTDTTLP